MVSLLLAPSCPQSSQTAGGRFLSGRLPNLDANGCGPASNTGASSCAHSEPRVGGSREGGPSAQRTPGVGAPSCVGCSGCSGPRMPAVGTAGQEPRRDSRPVRTPVGDVDAAEAHALAMSLLRYNQWTPNSRTGGLAGREHIEREMRRQSERRANEGSPPRDHELRREIGAHNEGELAELERLLQGLGVGRARFGTFGDGRQSQPWTPPVLSAGSRELVRRKV